MIERSIEGLLPAFFAQLMIGDALNGYSQPGWVNQIRNSGDSIEVIARAIPLDEEESQGMEVAMTDLRLSDPEAYTVLQLHWGHGWTDGKIARSIVPRSSRQEVERIRVGAQHRIQAKLGVPV